MSKKDVYRIEIPIETVDKYSKGIDKAKKDFDKFDKKVKKTDKNVEDLGKSSSRSAKSVETLSRSASRSEKHMTRFQRVVEGTKQRLRRLSKPWRFTVTAVDRASRVIRSVSNFADRTTRRTYRLTIKAVDLVTRPVRSIMSGLTSTMGMLGAAGGIAGGFVLPLKFTIERQNITTAFEVLLGSHEKAQKRIEELTTFAGQTPYARDEIFEASRVLQVFTGEALSTGKGLKLVGDVAAGTQQDFNDVALWMGRLYDAMASGRPVGEMTSRLQEMGAISGDARARLEDLAESGRDIKEIWPQVTKEFERYDGMMEKLSKNLSNLLLGVKTFFINNVLARWGEGIESILSPALAKFRDWRSEHSDAITAMGDEIERYGAKFTKFFVERIEQGAKYLDDLFFSDKYKDLSFGAKVKLMIDDAGYAFGDWWEKTGRDKVTAFTEKAGTQIGSLIKGVILGALGVESKGPGSGSGGSGAGVYVNAGVEVGKNFVGGFVKGLDPMMITKAIIDTLKNINKDAIKGEGSVIGALVADWIFLGLMSRILKPFGLLKVPMKMLGRAGKWGWYKTLGRNKKGGGGGKGGIPRRASTTRSERHEPKQRKLSFPKSKMPKGLTSTLKRVPYLGTALSMMGLFGLADGGISGALGSLGGGFAGAAGGAAIGSALFPGIGTAIGGLGGGVLGSIGGEKLLTWLFGAKKASAAAPSEKTTGVKQHSTESIQPYIEKNIYQPINQAISNAHDFGAAFANNFFLGLNSTGNTPFEWISNHINQPILQAVGNAYDFGMGFSNNFLIGMEQASIDVHPWINKHLYLPTLEAVGNAYDFGEGYAKNIYIGINQTPIDIHPWISKYIYQPTLQAVSNAYDFGNGFVGNFVAGMRSKKGDVSAEARELAKAVESAFRKELGIASPSKVMHDLGYWSAMGVVKGFSSVDISKIAKNQADNLMSGFGSVGGNIQQWIAAAMMLTGTPSSWLGPLATIAQRESGGNPRAKNLWDINAKRGIPSKGLMQTIDPTFNAYKMPGLDNIWNPIHNAVAAIRYIKSRYGTVFNTPGIRSMAAGGSYKGYERGGVITQEHIARVGERNKKEVIIPLEQHRSRAMGLLDYANRELGYGGNVVPISSVSGGGSVTIKFEGGIHAKVIVEGGEISNADEFAEEIADKVAGAIANKIERVSTNVVS